jgi:hypothetical protein
MKDLIVKLVLGEKVTKKDIYNALYEICDEVHSSCDSGCPVYELNEYKALGFEKPFDENRGCDCFKNGKAMAKFIKEKSPPSKKRGAL